MAWFQEDFPDRGRACDVPTAHGGSIPGGGHLDVRRVRLGGSVNSDRLVSADLGSGCGFARFGVG